MKLNNEEIYSIDTGKFTGRSPKDKWIVKNINSDSEKNIWWGDVNQSVSPEIFDSLYSMVSLLINLPCINHHSHISH